MPTVFVQIARPSERNPEGVAAQGEYEEAGGKVTLTKYNGQPILADRRKRYSQKLKDGDQPHIIARRLTLEYVGSLRKSFSGPIQYPSTPVV